jgi:hypothetical protein
VGLDLESKWTRWKGIYDGYDLTISCAIKPKPASMSLSLEIHTSAYVSHNYIDVQ